MIEKPGISSAVHYVSHGTPVREDGSQAFRSVCRAAIITEVGAWITVETAEAASFSRSEGRPIRHAEQWYYSDAVQLTVLNPTGQFFNACKHSQAAHVGGTWHWPRPECS